MMPDPMDPDFAEAGEPIVTLRMSKRRAEKLSHGISDLLCWVRGFKAARPDGDNMPFGDEEVRVLNIAIKNAIAEVETTK